MHVRTRRGQSSPTWRSGYIDVKDCTSLISPNTEANFQRPLFHIKCNDKIFENFLPP